jgi:isoquinoline 1-oxidoreductase alpha subunit
LTFTADNQKEYMEDYSIAINGNKVSVQAEADMPLLWVLRDLLSMKGTKFGCGQALCGACTVHLDGQAVRSCSLPISQVGDGQITTIEGLSEKGDHPLQDAWVKHIVPQCGYCQGGQIMTAAALLAVNPSPSDSEIDAAMEGNLCRCGTYNRIKEAILTASKSL